MKKPDQLGRVSELLYSDVGSVNSKVQNPPEFNNLVHPRPSIIPKVEYPITDEEEQLLDAAWSHAVKLSKRGLL